MLCRKKKKKKERRKEERMNVAPKIVMAGFVVAGGVLAVKAFHGSMNLPSGPWSSWFMRITGSDTTAANKQVNPTASGTAICQIRTLEDYVSYLAGQGKAAYADEVRGYSEAQWIAEVDNLQTNAMCFLTN
jgi:hypothetical protein